MKNVTKRLTSVFIPNRSLDKSMTASVIAVWSIGFFLVWMFSGSKFIPQPHDVLSAGVKLMREQHFMNDLLASTMLCMKAMLRAIIISLVIAYLSVLPFFRPLAGFVGKMRFLSTVGITFIFAQITSDTSHQKLAILVFGITVFMVTGMCQVISEVKKEELDYARTLKMNEWQSTLEIIILGKADQMFELIRQNFAIAWMMLAMVENICRADGGIGIILSDQNKHFHLESVYAIQIMILFVGMFFDWLLKVGKRVFFPYSVLTLERK